MLPEYCNEPELPEVCCTTLFDAAAFVLDAAWLALVDCAGEDACAPIQRFVAAAEPHLSTQDYLTVWFTSADIPQPRNQTAQAKGLIVQQPSVTFSVKLVESGWPSITQIGTQIGEESADEVAWASRHFLAHAESVWRGVVDWLATDNVCGTLKQYGQLRTTLSASAIAAQFSFTAEVKWRV